MPHAARVMFQHVLPLVGLLIASGSAGAQDLGSDLDGVVTYPVNHNLTLGNGWNWAQSAPVPTTCISGGFGDVKGDLERMTFSDVTDTSSFMHALSVSASAKASYALGSAGGSFAFAKSLETHDYHETIVATVIVSTERQFITASNLTVDPNAPSVVPAGSGFTSYHINPASVDLDPKRLPAAKLKPPTKFYQNCGDGYVSQVSVGGQMVVFYDFATHSEQERQEISARVSGSYGTMSASAAVNDTIKKYSDKGQLTITYASAGGDGSPLPITLDALKSAIEKFPASVQPSPVQLTLTVTPYASLHNWPSTGAVSRLATIDRLSDIYLEFSFIEQQAQRIDFKPNDYAFDPATSPIEVNSVEKKAGSAAAMAKQALAACRVNKPCIIPKGIPADDYDLRAMLPLAKNISEPGQVLAAARDALGTAKSTLASTPSTIDLDVPTMAGAGYGSGFRTVKINNPDFARAQAAVVAAQAALDDANKDFASKVYEERLSAWVIDTGQSRCVAQLEQPCLNPTRVNNYRTAALTLISAAPK